MRDFMDLQKPSGKCAFSWPLFLLGLFSETQIRVIGSIGIAELAIFVLGPFFLIKDWSQLRQKKFTPFLWLLILMFFSGMFSNWYNHTPFASAIRGLATPYSFLMGVTTFHHFLKGDIKKTRWFFIGLSLSVIISVFVFQRASVRYEDGYELSAAEAMERKMNYSLFWLQQISSALVLPINAFYLEIPKAYPVVVVLFLLVYGFAMSNNRSSLIIFGMSFFLFIVGGKRTRAMTFVKKHFAALALGAIFLAPLANFIYKQTAASGLLGENAQKKYEQQVGKNATILQTLMGGRSEVFIGLTACLDQPFAGFGAWAEDTQGYTSAFFAKHGATEKDIEWLRSMEERGRRMIPAHSWLVQSWLWYGIGGLIWVLYLGKLILGTLKNCLGAIPHLYGYFAFFLPAHIWNWCFSPLGGRTQLAMFFTLCLFARYFNQLQKRSAQCASW